MGPLCGLRLEQNASLTLNNNNNISFSRFEGPHYFNIKIIEISALYWHTGRLKHFTSCNAILAKQAKLIMKSLKYLAECKIPEVLKTGQTGNTPIGQKPA